MADTADGGRITEKEFDSLASSFVLDLVAFFAEMESEIMKTLDRATDEGWDEETLIKEIENLI